MAIDSRHPSSPSSRSSPFDQGVPKSNFGAAVGLAVATAVLVFALLTLATSWFRAQRADPRGSSHPVAAFAPEVDLWVGDLAPGVRGVLASEWNDAHADADYDARMNAGLGLSAGRALAYYRLVVFNTTDRSVTLTFRDGELTLTPKGEAPLPMVSLAALLSGRDGNPAPASSQAVVLRELGAGRESIDLPSGSRHSHPIAFPRRVPLAEVASVASADGSGFKLGAVIVCHCGTEEQANVDLRPLLEFGEPAMVEIGPMPYPAMNTMLDAGYPKGALNYWKSNFFADLADDVIDILVDSFAAAPSPMGGMIFEHFHGAVTRIPETETAWPLRQEGYNLVITSEWLDPATTEENIAWTRELYAKLEPHAVGRRYVNYLDADDADDAIRAAYGPNYDRLVEVKRRYDPDNVFHLNHNIQP